MNPIATFNMENGQKIIVELLPKIAPNTVNSFIYLAKKGCYNNHSIQRIVPGSWIDLSYSAFGKDYAKYFIENEAKIQNSKEIHYGQMCMGGYSDNEIASGEVFFPLRDCKDLQGKYPILGNVIEGLEILKEIEKVETKPIKLEQNPDMIINEPIVPVIIRSVEIETYGIEYAEPKKVAISKMPEKW